MAIFRPTHLSIERPRHQSINCEMNHLNPHNKEVFECIQSKATEKIQGLQEVQSERTQEMQHNQMMMQENQREIQRTLDSVAETIKLMGKTIDAIGASNDRIFKLYEEHEKEIKDLNEKAKEFDVFKSKKEVENGNTEKQNEETHKEIQQLIEKRGPIYERLTTLENTKADKEDVNNLMKEVIRGNTMLEEHCKQDAKVDTDTKWYQERMYQIIIFVIGIIVSLAIYFNT